MENEIQKKKTYRFAYREINVGFIDVVAHSVEEAREKAQNDNDGAFIHTSEYEINDLIEEIEDED